MLIYVIRRLIETLLVLLLVTFFTFSLLLMTGNPVTALTGYGRTLSAEQIEQRRIDLGLDKPIPVQYVNWMGKVLQGDLGKSAINGRSVANEVKARLPVSLELGTTAIIFSILISIPFGVIAARKRGSKLDAISTVISIGAAAMPDFWLGILLILLCSTFITWIPTFGFVSVFVNPIEGLKHLILPAIALGASMAAGNMRQTRSAMLENLAQDYVRTARAKGLSENAVVWVHTFRNALLPVITLLGLSVTRIIGGSVIIETMFSVPGMGKMLVDSIFSRDFPVTQGCILVFVCLICIVNLAVDILYTYADPRIKYG